MGFLEFLVDIRFNRKPVSSRLPSTASLGWSGNLEIAVFALAPDSVFSIDKVARITVSGSCISTGIGLLCDFYVYLRFALASLPVFKVIGAGHIDPGGVQTIVLGGVLYPWPDRYHNLLTISLLGPDLDGIRAIKAPGLAGGWTVKGQNMALIGIRALPWRHHSVPEGSKQAVEQTNPVDYHDLKQLLEEWLSELRRTYTIHCIQPSARPELLSYAKPDSNECSRINWMRDEIYGGAPLITNFKRESIFKAHFQLKFAFQTAIGVFFSQESVSRLFPRAGPSKYGIALL
ncbi:hypothetical protein DFH09DRAFT_1090798 [Mycena vulgaris]|nr:hypothetical protein DFH09DRAFT_1090798 [Mycena vulgaris]